MEQLTIRMISKIDTVRKELKTLPFSNSDTMILHCSWRVINHCIIQRL